MGDLIEKSKPYVGMISLQFGYAGMNIITKVSLDKGMNHYVLVVYRHAFATIALAPIAFFVERKGRPKLTFYVFCQIFVLGLLGPVIDQNFYYLGLKLTTPTFACALSNLLPALTFVMALLFRMEKVNIKNLRSQAKILGTIVSVGGAMLMTLYEGPIVPMPWSPHHHSHETSETAAISNKNLITGSLLVIAATLAWSALFILQTAVLKKYSAQLSLSTLICFFGTLQAAVLGAAMVRHPSDWKLGWDINLLAAVYAGVVTSALAYYIQGLCIRVKGPVFATAFTPLMMIIAAVMSSIILSESIFLGSVLGGLMIATGLYFVLWGKLKDSKISGHNNCSELVSNSEVFGDEGQNKVDDEEVCPVQIMTKGYLPHQLIAQDTAISVTSNNNPKM